MAFVRQFALALLAATQGGAYALLAAVGPKLHSVAPAAVHHSASPTMILGTSTVHAFISSAVTRPQRVGPPRADAGAGDTGDGVGGGGDDDESEPEPEPDEEPPSNPLVNVWKSYETALDEKPLLMKALTSFTGFFIGDVLAQVFIQKQEFDWFRLFRLASFGFLVHGTTSHWFYGKLDGAIPGTTAPVVFSKVFIDQVLWNPIFGVMFFSYVALLEAKGLSYVTDKVQNELLTQVTGSWKVWPLAHAINFRFIPSSQRVLYINTIQIGYNCFLSLISNRDSPKAA